MKTNITTNNFTFGQLTQWGSSRVDVEHYSKTAKSLKNCLVRPYGGVFRRPGLEFITETKLSTKTRLIPFVFSVIDTFIIEVGVGYFRFIKNDEYVENASVIYEVSNDYSEEDISNLKFVQSNDVVFMVDGNHKQASLSRLADDDWSFDYLDIVGGPFLTENTDENLIFTCSGTTGSITINSNFSAFEPGHVGSVWSVGTKTSINDVLVQGWVKITGYTNDTTVTAEVGSELTLTAGQTSFFAEGAWSDVKGYPSVITFHDKRLWFGNSPSKQETVWGSEVFVYNNFSVEESLEQELPSNQRSIITSLVSSKDLIVNTFGGAYVISSGSSSIALTDENIYAYKSSNFGSNNVQGASIGDFTYYAQLSGEKIREFKYSWEVEGYQSEEVSFLGEDVLSSGITDMTVQVLEDNVLWCTLQDGRIATLTRSSLQSVSALSPQETDGKFLSVASIPKSGQFWDDVYTIVEREIDGQNRQYIEKFSKPRKASLEAGIYCDSAVIYEGIETDVVTGLSHLEGKQVVALRDGSVEENLTVSGGQVTLPKAGTCIIVGLPYSSEIETNNLENVSSSIGYSLGSFKRVADVSIDFIDTTGVEIVGEETDYIFQRGIDIPMGSPQPLFTGRKTVLAPNNSDFEQTIKIIQDNPLPMNVIGLTYKINIKDR